MVSLVNLYIAQIYGVRNLNENALHAVIGRKEFQITLKQRMRSNFECFFISTESMASKGTPKKFYKKRSESTGCTSRCRLCNSISDPGHSKNLFRKNNQATLRNAEIIYGGELPQNSNLPYLICTPCERRLDNAIQLKKTIAETQRTIQEDLVTKRCLKVSPSVQKPPTKVRSTGSSRRRSIDFSAADQSESSPGIISLNVSTFVCCVYQP